MLCYENQVYTLHKLGKLEPINQNDIKKIISFFLEDLSLNFNEQQLKSIVDKFTLLQKRVLFRLIESYDSCTAIVKNTYEMYVRDRCKNHLKQYIELNNEKHNELIDKMSQIHETVYTIAEHSFGNPTLIVSDENLLPMDANKFDEKVHIDGKLEDKLQDERKKLEDEKKKFEDEQKRFNEEKKKHEEDKKKFEDELKKFNEDKKKFEDEKKKLEEKKIYTVKDIYDMVGNVDVDNAKYEELKTPLRWYSTRGKMPCCSYCNSLTEDYKRYNNQYCIRSEYYDAFIDMKYNKIDIEYKKKIAIYLKKLKITLDVINETTFKHICTYETLYGSFPDINKLVCVCSNINPKYWK